MTFKSIYIYIFLNERNSAKKKPLPNSKTKQSSFPPAPLCHDGKGFFPPTSPHIHPLGSRRVPCVSNCRFLTSSRTFSWSTCCKMSCRRFSWAIPIRSSFLSVSLSRARPAGFQEIKGKANEQRWKRISVFLWADLALTVVSI